MELAELVDEAGKIIGLAKYLGTESTVLSSSDFAKVASESVSIEYMSLSFCRCLQIVSQGLRSCIGLGWFPVPLVETRT